MQGLSTFQVSYMLQHFAYQDPTNEEAGYLSSNISDVSPIIDPPPRPTPRGPNRLA